MRASYLVGLLGSLSLQINRVMSTCLSTLLLQQRIKFSLLPLPGKRIPPVPRGACQCVDDITYRGGLLDDRQAVFNQ